MQPGIKDDQKLHGFGRPTAAVSIHMCVSENINSGLHLRVKGNKDLAHQLLLHPKDQGLQGFDRPSALGAYTCAEICQFKVAPKSAMGQRLQRLGRPVVAVSKHLCVAEYVSSGLYPTFQGYKGFADEVLLQAYTHVYCRNQGCTQGSKFYQSFADHLLL